MPQRWRTVGNNTESDLTGWDLNPTPPAPETKTLPLDQLAGKGNLKEVKVEYFRWISSQSLVGFIFLFQRLQ